MKEALKETHVFPFFCASRYPTNCQGREAKICGVSGSGDESLATKRGTKCTQKRPCPEMHGFCNFAFFVHQKSRAPERVKRDPHVFDLVLFLQALFRVRKVCAPFGSGNGPQNLFLVIFWTSNGFFRTEILEWFPPSSHQHTELGRMFAPAGPCVW